MSSFSFCSADHHLEVVDRRSTTFRSEHTFKIIANVESRFFVRDYTWTGSGVEREKPPEVVADIDVWGMPSFRMHGPLLVEGNSRIMVVDLGRTLGVGEEEAVTFKHHMKDLAGTFRPFLSIKPSTKIRDRLDLRLTLPDWRGLKCFYRRFTHDTEKVVFTEPMTLEPTGDGKISVHKQILNPSEQNMGHVLEWSHTEG
jgi:hypothetical protein